MQLQGVVKNVGCKAAGDQFEARNWITRGLVNLPNNLKYTFLNDPSTYKEHENIIFQLSFVEKDVAKIFWVKVIVIRH
jgi:hypothetical protein